MRKTLQIKTLTQSNFGKYGVTLEHINQVEGYEPLVVVKSRGWIWAVLTFRRKATRIVECHRTTKESFEPVFGTTVIVLAPPEDPDHIEAFLLDKAVLLHEGVWHEVLAISDVSRVKITENSDVTGEKHDLGYEVRVALVCEGSD